ncbi:putative Sulfotransferase 1C2 [Hypsibius exemplaris]|uniref:Sulfotransferase 1C2 n=1 Tax=Hypsibius exemplaris TaxID=2072580 RepID=A0A1W0X5D5_HYPEX|nr:putative Sulfotransferase 1C2 [Hypsibius exemplaris]
MTTDNVDTKSDPSPAVRYEKLAVAPPPLAITYHHPDFLKPYRGFLIRYPFYDTLEAVEKFEASPLTWPSVPYPKPAPEQWEVNRLAKMKPGRLFDTHLAYTCLPPSVITSGTKKAFIYRNPKDDAISTYYIQASQPQILFKGTLSDVVDSFVNDTMMFGPFFEHLASYWARRDDDPNIFVCSFEELKTDFKSTVARLAQFLGKDLTSDQIDVIHEETNFKAAQVNPSLNRSERHAAGVFDFTKHLFVRNGSIGQWKKEFTPEMNSKMDDWIDRKMKGAARTKRFEIYIRITLISSTTAAHAAG